jgi:hypothetical protein
VKLLWVAVPLVAVILIAGIWFFGAAVTNDFRTSMALTAAWFAATGLAALVIARRSHRLRWLVLGSYTVTAIVAGGVLAYTTFHDRVVNEQVVVAGNTNVEVAAGSFVSDEHRTTGDAAIIGLADGSRKLTITNLDTSAGPDLRVYVTAEPVRSSSSVGEHIDLGSLKGNKGTQQYDLSSDFDAVRYDNVVIWCRAFSVAFGEAPLVKSADAM